MDERNRLELSKYRLEKAEKELLTAKENFNNKNLNASANRSYYAIFHALRSVLAIDGFDSKTHKGIISYFKRNYVKVKIFPSDTSSIINTAFDVRGNADYEDYFEVTPGAALEQIENAEYIIGLINSYLRPVWAEMEHGS